MRRTITAPGASRPWRRRRAARIAVAVILVALAPFADRVGTSDPGAAATASSPDGTDRAGTDRHGPDPETEEIRVVPVPLADPGVADVLQPGDLVDLVSTVVQPTDATGVPADPSADGVVARAARVRSIPAGSSGTRSILVEVPTPDAARLAAIAVGTPLAVVVHG